MLNQYIPRKECDGKVSRWESGGMAAGQLVAHPTFHQENSLISNQESARFAAAAAR
jgi:hypothetical protein